MKVLHFFTFSVCKKGPPQAKKGPPQAKKGPPQAKKKRGVWGVPPQPQKLSAQHITPIPHLAHKKPIGHRSNNPSLLAQIDEFGPCQNRQEFDTDQRILLNQRISSGHSSLACLTVARAL